MSGANNRFSVSGDVITSVLAVALFVGMFVFLFTSIISAVPQGATNIDIDLTETAGNTTGTILNTSGGTISTINITGATQNPRWKAFVGQVSGSFSLDDASGATIYDWSIASVGGEVYATINDSTLTWTAIQCATTAQIEAENSRLSHTSPDDNITRTFNDTTHAEMFVGTVNISTNSCSTLNTYVGNATQDASFEELALVDSAGTATSLIYATVIESNVEGFDNNNYDFQMIVPEVGSTGFSGQTAYYMYVELS